MFAFWSSLNHIPMKFRGLIKKTSHLRPIYERERERESTVIMKLEMTFFLWFLVTNRMRLILNWSKGKHVRGIGSAHNMVTHFSVQFTDSVPTLSIWASSNIMLSPKDYQCDHAKFGCLSQSNTRLYLNGVWLGVELRMDTTTVTNNNGRVFKEMNMCSHLLIILSSTINIIRTIHMVI